MLHASLLSSCDISAAGLYVFSICRRTHDGFEEEDEVVAVEEERQAQQKKAEEDAVTGALSYLTPVEARAHLRELWTKERSLLQNLFGILALASSSHESPVDMFFLEALVVPPTRFRPVSSHLQVLHCTSVRAHVAAKLLRFPGCPA